MFTYWYCSVNQFFKGATFANFLHSVHRNCLFPDEWLSIAIQTLHTLMYRTGKGKKKIEKPLCHQ
jgi:hypothetical protein